MRLYSTIALAAVATVLAAPAVADAKTRHHGATKAAVASTAAELREAQEQISALQSRLNALEARLDQQGSQGQTAVAAANQAAAASQQAADASAKADHALAVADTAKTEAVKADKGLDLVKWAKNTQVSGRMFFDESTITQHTNGGPNANSGTGFNIKRMYLGVDHQFSPVFSGTLLMDISNVIGETANTNYVTPATTVGAPTCTTVAGAVAGTYTTTCTAPAAANLGSAALVGRGLYVKNAFLQMKLDPALVIRAGAAPLPWVPFMEGQYGFRHIENVTIDRLSYGTSADWGIHVLGDLLGGHVSYQVSAIDGAGYRNVKVTKNVDIEGRVSAQYAGFWAAAGGYTGKRGNGTQSLNGTPVTFRTATRWDVAGGYKAGPFNIGGEYFHAKNWNNVTVNPVVPATGLPIAYSQDAAQGYSVFGNYNITPKWTVFGRYDWNQPNRITDPALRDHYFNVGLQWEPVKVVDLALVYKRETAHNGSVSTTDGVIGCGTSATANTFATVAADISGSCVGNGTYDEVGIFGQFKF